MIQMRLSCNAEPSNLCFTAIHQLHSAALRRFYLLVQSVQLGLVDDRAGLDHHFGQRSMSSRSHALRGSAVFIMPGNMGSHAERGNQVPSGRNDDQSHRADDCIFPADRRSGFFRKGAGASATRSRHTAGWHSMLSIRSSFQPFSVWERILIKDDRLEDDLAPGLAQPSWPDRRGR